MGLNLNIEPSTLAELNAAVTDATLDDASDPRTPTAHTHTLSEVTDAGTAAGLDFPASGDAAAGEVVKGDDTRLTDARTPTAHTHTTSEITDYITAVTVIDNTDSPYSATWGEDIEADASAGAITINLPTAVGNSGEEITVTRTNSTTTSDVTVDGNASETINGSLTQTLAKKYTSVTFKSNGTNITLR